MGKTKHLGFPVAHPAESWPLGSISAHRRRHFKSIPGKSSRVDEFVVAFVAAQRMKNWLRPLAGD
jgi:hypothetical protein